MNADLRFDRGHRVASHPSKGLNLSFHGVRLGGGAAMLQGVLLPLGAPAPAPCIRQTLLTAGAWHRNPLRFDLAWHLNAWCIGQCMGFSSDFFRAPTPRLAR
jgi:hypothetical protein